MTDLYKLRDSIAASQRQRALSVAQAVAEVEAIKDGNGINSLSQPSSPIEHHLSSNLLPQTSSTRTVFDYSEDSPMRSRLTVPSTIPSGFIPGNNTTTNNNNNNNTLSPQIKSLLLSGSDDEILTLTRKELRMFVSESVSLAVAEAFDAAREQNSDNIEELLAGSKNAAEKQKHEAVKEALSTASIDFRNQMITALGAMRDTLTKENQREIASIVAKTDVIRAETISLCEQRLEEFKSNQIRDRQALAQARTDVRRLREILLSHGITINMDESNQTNSIPSSSSSSPLSKKQQVFSSSSSSDTTYSFHTAPPPPISKPSPVSSPLSKQYTTSPNNVKPPSLPMRNNNNSNDKDEEEDRRYGVNTDDDVTQSLNTDTFFRSKSTSSFSISSPPPKPPAVSQRLYDTILSLPVASLRSLLDKAGIPNKDSIERVDLMTKLLIAVEKGATVYSSSNSVGEGTGGGIVESYRDNVNTGGIISSSPIGTDDQDHFQKFQQFDRPKTPDSQVRVMSSSSSLSSYSTQISSSPAGGGKTHNTPERKVTSPLDQQQHYNNTDTISSTSSVKVSSPAELKNWLPVKNEDGTTYYYHKVTRVTRWDRPELDVARRVEERIREETAATKARQQERLAELQAEEQARVAAAAARFRNENDIESRVSTWNTKHKGGIRSLLASLSSVLAGTTLVGTVPEEILHLVGPTAGASYGEENLRKAYKMALRIVHPDKVESSRPEEELLAQKVFSTLSDAYKKYTAGGGDNLYTFPTSSTSSSSSTSVRTGGGKYMGVNAPLFEGINTKNVMEAAAARARASMAAIQKEQMAQQAKRASAVSGGIGGLSSNFDPSRDPIKAAKANKAAANAPYGFAPSRR
jgi:hypothetical protein